jgi:predicted Zn-dependent peptidase
MQQNSEVDINVLVNLYNTRLAAALNQNVLLEAKLQTLKNDFEKERNDLLEQLANYTDNNGDTTK